MLAKPVEAPQIDAPILKVKQFLPEAVVRHFSFTCQGRHRLHKMASYMYTCGACPHLDEYAALDVSAVENGMRVKEAAVEGN